MTSRRKGLSPKRRRNLGFAAVAGVALVAIVAFFAFGPNKNPPPETLTTLPADLPPKQVPAPITSEAKQIAVRFIQTAVARKNLEEAWTLVGPNLRGGLTREEWITGNNPVVPYPIAELAVAPFKVDESFKDSALIEVVLIPKKTAGVKAQTFFLGLVKVGTGSSARWVVDNWVPRSSAIIPR